MSADKIEVEGVEFKHCAPQMRLESLIFSWKIAFGIANKNTPNKPGCAASSVPGTDKRESGTYI
jgi:hypothetical protein